MVGTHGTLSITPKSAQNSYALSLRETRQLAQFLGEEQPTERILDYLSALVRVVPAQIPMASVSCKLMAVRVRLNGSPFCLCGSGGVNADMGTDIGINADMVRSLVGF